MLLSMNETTATATEGTTSLFKAKEARRARNADRRANWLSDKFGLAIGDTVEITDTGEVGVIVWRGRHDIGWRHVSFSVDVQVDGSVRTVPPTRLDQPGRGFFDELRKCNACHGSGEKLERDAASGRFRREDGELNRVPCLACR
jgi:hypothetical protein